MSRRAKKFLRRGTGGGSGDGGGALDAEIAGRKLLPYVLLQHAVRDGERDTKQALPEQVSANTPLRVVSGVEARFDMAAIAPLPTVHAPVTCTAVVNRIGTSTREGQVAKDTLGQCHLFVQIRRQCQLLGRLGGIVSIANTEFSGRRR